eukprot:jgi/Chlat1/8483/Chrsp80S07930
MPALTSCLSLRVAAVAPHWNVSCRRQYQTSFRFASQPHRPGRQGVAAQMAAAVDPKTAVVLVKDRQPVPCDQGAGDFLRTAPRGAYTTVRTVEGNAVFEFDFHVNRLAESARLMMEADAKAANQDPDHIVSLHHDLVQAEKVRPRVIKSFQAAAQEFRSKYPSLKDEELRITILATWQGEMESLQTHVGVLPARPSPPVRVEVRGAPRVNAAAKDSEWVRERQDLEKAKALGVNEVCLVGDDGSVMEGLTSNFYVVMNGAVHTAGEGILLGSVRKIVLEVCKREGIPLVLKAPNIGDLHAWEGALISSTSRVLLPVDEITAHWRATTMSRSFGSSLSRLLEGLVLEEVVANSVQVL